MKAVNAPFFSSVIVALGLSAIACGSSDDDSGQTTGTVTGNEPSGSGGTDPGTGGSTSGAGGSNSNACNAAFDQSDTGGRECASKHDGQCFESDAEACACAGCADDCLIAESYPTQVSCVGGSSPRDACAVGFPRAEESSDQVCNLITESLCFVEESDACACAGCARGCLILESFPAQVACE